MAETKTKMNWIDIKYAIKGFDSGVISQGAFVRRYKKENPDVEVLNVTGFKIDHEKQVVRARIGVKAGTGLNIFLENQNQAGGGVCGVSKPVGPGALKILAIETNAKLDEKPVNPNFAILDEFADSKSVDPADALKEVSTTYANLQVKYERLLEQLGEQYKMYDALVDENESLRATDVESKNGPCLCGACADNVQLRIAAEKIMKGIDSPGLPNDPNDDLEIAYDIDNACHYGFEQAILACGEILAEALGGAKKDDFVAFNATDFQDVDLSPMTVEELSDAAIKVAESEATGKPLLAPRKIVTQAEVKADANYRPTAEIEGRNCGGDFYPDSEDVDGLDFAGTKEAIERDASVAFNLEE